VEVTALADAVIASEASARPSSMTCDKSDFTSAVTGAIMAPSMHAILVLVLVPVVLVAGIVIYLRFTTGDLVQPTKNLTVTSPAFADGGSMPRQYSGRGEDLSPPLDIPDISPDAQSIAVIMDDHDHPAGIFNH
jgi:hypothetical protein